MDKAIFEFSYSIFEEDEVKDFSREYCEELCNLHEDDVMKYNIDTDKDMQAFIESVDTDNYCYRAFIC